MLRIECAPAPITAKEGAGQLLTPHRKEYQKPRALIADGRRVFTLDFV